MSTPQRVRVDNILGAPFVGTHVPFDDMCSTVNHTHTTPSTIRQLSRSDVRRVLYLLRTLI